MGITTHFFGKTRDGQNVHLFRITNTSGACVELLDYGCTVRSIRVPDRTGKLTDVCLGYDTVGEYEQNDAYFGGVIGRYCNRIRGAQFTLNGTLYQLCQNDGRNFIHGGRKGFDKYVWAASVSENSVTFSRCSPYGEEGFPGSVGIGVVYTFTDDNALSIRYYAKTDADTVISLTNHAYFNLAGGGTIEDNLLTIYADSFCECDGEYLPTGRLLPVEGTPFDFRTPKPIGRDIGADDQQLKFVGGYDHNYALNTSEGLFPAAELTSPRSGITMKVFTTLPGVQLYTGNSTSDRQGKNGARYGRRESVCLETQFYPDSPNHPDFPPCVFKRGAVFDHETVFAFSAAEM